jgi:hypothetical protein
MKKIIVAAAGAFLASTVGGYAQNGASELAPGQVKKLDETGLIGANDLAPGRVKGTGSAKRFAPGQLKDDLDDDLRGDGARAFAPGRTKLGKAANDVAPGRLKQDGMSAKRLAPGHMKN